MIECYINGYLIDNVSFEFELSDCEKQIITEASYIIENNATIRCCSDNLGVSKSKVHRDMLALKGISFEMYKCVRRIFQSHVKRRLLYF